MKTYDCKTPVEAMTPSFGPPVVVPFMLKELDLVIGPAAPLYFINLKHNIKSKVHAFGYNGLPLKFVLS